MDVEISVGDGKGAVGNDGTCSVAAGAAGVVGMMVVVVGATVARALLVSS